MPFSHTRLGPKGDLNLPGGALPTATTVRVVALDIGVGLVDADDAPTASEVALSDEIPFRHRDWGYPETDRREVRLPPPARERLKSGRFFDVVVDWSADVVRIWPDVAWPFSYPRSPTELDIDDERDRMRVAQDTNRPIELRLEALAGIRQTEADPWPPGSLDAYRSIIVDRSNSYDDRLQAARACSAFGDLLEEDRKALFVRSSRRTMLTHTLCTKRQAQSAARSPSSGWPHSSRRPARSERLRELVSSRCRSRDGGRRGFGAWPKRLSKARSLDRPGTCSSRIREDAATVDQLVADLQSLGIAIWRDIDKLKPGERWRANHRTGDRGGRRLFGGLLSCVGGA